MGIKYISKGEWFDKGTEVDLVNDYREDERLEYWDAGLFEGMRYGKIDQEVCTFDEFIIKKNGEEKRKDKSTR